MKVRQGFVSNSSSASFIIKKDSLTPRQIDFIYNHEETAKMFDRVANWLIEREDYPAYWKDDKYSVLFGYYDTWKVIEKDDEIIVRTSMDNFDMERFLQLIGVHTPDMETWHS